MGGRPLRGRGSGQGPGRFQVLAAGEALDGSAVGRSLISLSLAPLGPRRALYLGSYRAEEDNSWTASRFRRQAGGPVRGGRSWRLILHRFHRCPSPRSAMGNGCSRARVEVERRWSKRQSGRD